MESTPNPNACKYCGKVVLMKCATQDQADFCAFNYQDNEK
jgi:hypothetical protein